MRLGNGVLGEVVSIPVRYSDDLIPVTCVNRKVRRHLTSVPE